MATRKTPAKKTAKKSVKKSTVTPLRKQRQPSQDRQAIIDAMDEGIVELERLRAESKDIGERMNELQGEVLAGMKRLGWKTHRFRDQSGDLHQATFVQSSSDIVNEPMLKKKLGAALWKKVTRQTLDKKLLDAHIASGDIDPAVVASCSEEKLNNPYIKIS
jgi:hypothetical protein